MIGRVIRLVLCGNGKSDMNEFTSSGTASDLGQFAVIEQPLVEGCNGRVEAGSAESGLIEDAAARA
jgi:hypothetical protein